MNLNTLKAELIRTLDDDQDHILNSRYPEDNLYQYVDGAVPVYNSQLIELLMNHPDLGYGPNDGGLLPDAPSVWQIITMAVYEELSNTAGEWLHDRQNALEEEDTL